MFSKLRPILFLFLPLMLLMSSCLKGDLEDLEKQLQELEDALGSNEPIVMNFETTTTDADPIIKNSAFLFKGSDADDNYMEDNGDGTYSIYVERALDIGFDENVWVYFYYDSNTDEVTYFEFGMYWYDKYYRSINPYFYEGQANVEIDFKLNSINTTTGQVSFTVNAQTNESYNNEYAGQPMNCKLDFNGTLGLFVE